MKKGVWLICISEPKYGDISKNLEYYCNDYSKEEDIVNVVDDTGIATWYNSEYFKLKK